MDTKREILQRYISDKFSFNDYLSVSSDFKKDELKDLMKDDWQVTEKTSIVTERMNQLLDRMHHQITVRVSAKTSKSLKLRQIFSRIAAVLIVPALITIAILSYFSISDHASDAFAEIYSPNGARTRFKLPDGTQGWLNSGSSIKYPINFEERRVEISGEAWFDVVHQKSKEFRVVTPYFDVKVLGTRFNVIAYDKEITAEVILERGKVVVLDSQNNIKVEMLPDQQIVYNKVTKQLIQQNIDSKSYTSWRDGLLVCRNMTMADIAKRLGRKYNAEIIIHGDSLKKSVFRATFEDENLDEIFKMLSTVAPIKYKIHDRKIRSDSTFDKRTVEMWINKKI